jgi:hypothetical protein
MAKKSKHIVATGANGNKIVTVQGFDVIFRNLEKQIAQFRDNTVSEAEKFAATLENEAKDNAPWTDRTGDARRSIAGTSEVTNTRVTVAIAIGVDYGIWLEIANDGKYGIIEKTALANRHKFIAAIKSAWKEQ